MLTTNKETPLATGIADGVDKWEAIDLSDAFSISSVDTHCKMTYGLTWDDTFNPAADLTSNSVIEVNADDGKTASVTLNRGADTIDGIHVFEVQAKSVFGENVDKA